MKELPRSLAAYAATDAVLERELGSGAVPAQVKAGQILDDRARFLPCWGQCEIESGGECRDAVRRRRFDSDWQIRRAWDLYDPEDRRFSGSSFEERVRLVLDAPEGRGGSFATTLEHDGIGIQIAHGQLRTPRIDVGAFVEDCFTIPAALHGAT